MSTTMNGWVVERAYVYSPEEVFGRTDLLPEGSRIDLITPAELVTIEYGTVLYDIFGFPATVGVDDIDTDTRGGYLAYGYVKE